MILDCHIHLGKEADREEFWRRLEAAGVDGGFVFSEPGGERARPAEQRVEHVLSICEGQEYLFPFLFINPLDDGAPDQVRMAVDAGVKGFKIICGAHSVKDERCMAVANAIAEQKRPLLFHSGILWDGRPSSVFNRPAEFEAMFEVPDLKFAMAHISWPWCDECIAVYGKFLQAFTGRANISCEMFIDTTPGTPVIYREEALTKLFTVGYDVENNVMFGSDNRVGDYDVEWIKDWVARDKGILSRLGVSEEVQEKVFSQNLLRFVGALDVEVEKRSVLPR